MPDGLDRLHRAAIRSKPKGVRAKFRLVDGFQDHAERFLDNPIADRRNTQSTLPLLPRILRF
jgi:hypothetical protein